MKLGIASLIYHQRGFFNCLKDIANAGYNFVELNCVIGYYAHFNPIQLADDAFLLQHVKQALADNKLACSAVDCHGLAQGAKTRLPYTARCVEAGIDIARELNAPCVITSFPNGEATWEERVDVTRKLAQKAAEHNIKLAIEAEAGFVINNTTTMLKFIHDVGDNLITVNFDPYHYVIAGEDPVEAMCLLKEHIAHIHLKDVIDGKPAPYLGTPNSPADRVLQELKVWNFQNVVSAETQAEICDQPEILARKILKGIKERL